MKRPRFSWSRYGFLEPKNRLSYAGCFVGGIRPDGAGWQWYSGAEADYTPAWLAACVPTVTSDALYATPAEARAALEAFVRPLIHAANKEPL